MFSDVLATLARQGLHRANAPLVEVYFNYVRFSGRLTHLEVLPAGVGHTDLDLMITMTPDTGTVRLDHNLDILDADTATGLGEEFLRLLGETAEDATAVVRVAAVHAGESATAVQQEPVQQAPVEGPRLALAATFALGNLPLMCEAALEDERTTVAEAPYHQVLAALQDPSGVLADPATAVGVVLLRAADLERFGPVDDTVLAELRGAYPAALKSLAERTRRPLVVGILPTARPTDRLLAWERGSPPTWPDCPASRCSGRTSGPGSTPSRTPSTSAPSASPTCPSARPSRQPWRCAWPRWFGPYGVPRPR
ncbi:hypothetical protein O1M54_46295 [Streptomyces diastatochromogenes]|nr:hypothetical protein [Streptomyces diastatochromogenes]